VEKSELEVLAGIEEDDWEKIRQIVMEVHSTELYEQVAPLLEKRGFHFAVERTFGEPGLGPQAADVYMLYARREEAGAHTSDNQGDEAHDQLATARPQNPPLSIKDLHRFLSARLPDYMVPSSFVELDALPLTPSGKINRRALPAPEYSGLEGEREYIKPRTHVEEVVAGAYSKVLGIEQVGAGDNFFELGGHSLLATQVVSRLREVLQVGVTLRDIFEAPVVSALSEVIEAATNGAQNLGGAHSERPAEVSTG
jgi:hypothetical protein